MTSRRAIFILVPALGLAASSCASDETSEAVAALAPSYHDSPYDRLWREALANGERYPVAVFRENRQRQRLDVVTFGMEHSGGTRYPVVGRRWLRFLDVGDQLADSRTCPQVAEVIEELAALPAPQIRLADWTTGPSPTTIEGPPDWSGAHYRLKAWARFENLAGSDLEYRGGGAELVGWFSQTLQALRPCWGEGPPDDPAPTE